MPLLISSISGGIGDAIHLIRSLINIIDDFQAAPNMNTNGVAVKTSGANAEVTKKRKETILDLSKYLDKTIKVKFSGGREASGVLKGFDQSVNLVLDNAVEYLRGKDEV